MTFPKSRPATSTTKHHRQLPANRDVRHALLRKRTCWTWQRPFGMLHLGASRGYRSVLMDDGVKKGIFLRFFGRTNKSIARCSGSGGRRYRGDINDRDPSTRSKCTFFLVSCLRTIHTYDIPLVHSALHCEALIY